MTPNMIAYRDFDSSITLSIHADNKEMAPGLLRVNNGQEDKTEHGWKEVL